MDGVFRGMLSWKQVADSLYQSFAFYFEIQRVRTTGGDDNQTLLFDEFSEQIKVVMSLSTSCSNSLLTDELIFTFQLTSMKLVQLS